MAQTTSAPVRKPIFLTTIGIATIVAMFAMPFIAGAPDSEKASDMVRFLGRFHPVLLHLPIGIVSMALFLEIARFFQKDKARAGAGSLVLGLAAASSVVAVIAGFLLYQGEYDGKGNALVEQHLWRGIWFAAAMIVTFVLKGWADAGISKEFAPVSRLMLFISAGVMGLASHDGGSITHGSDYLTKYAPEKIRGLMGEPAKEKKPGEKGGAPGGEGGAEVPLESQVVYTSLVAPIFEKRCNSCHNEDKIRGKLRMDTYEMLLKGGKNGPAIEPGSAAKSHIMVRVELPLEDEEHMPPDKKPEMEAHERAVVKWWLDKGADPKKTVAELQPGAEVLEAIAKLGKAAPKGSGVAQSGTPAGTTPGAGAAEGHAPATPADANLKKQVAGFAKDFPGALTFESQQSPLLSFTAVSLRQNLDDATFQKLSPVVKHLVTADLSATKVTDKSVALLSSASNLKMVRLSETGITDASIDTLVKLPKLESVNLYSTAVTDAGVQKLAALPNLKRLYLWQTKVTPPVVEELKKKLPKCEIITGT